MWRSPGRGDRRPDRERGGPVIGTLLIALGALLVTAAVGDAAITTLAAGNGGGPLTRRVGRWTWRGLRAVCRRGRSRTLSYAGVVVLLVTVLTWVLLLWSGWTLIFSGADAAVVDPQTGAPASTASRIYFAGFVVFTLGVGDLVAGTGAWQVVTAGASFVGLFLVTLSITYLISVVSAAVQRRALARTIHLSGETGADIVLLHWDGSQVSGQFAALTSTLATSLLQVTQQHLAYPVLHHFHAHDSASSAPRALAALDDALVLLDAGLDPAARPARDVLVRLRRAMEHYAQTVSSGHGDPADPPPLPALTVLRDAHVPTVDDTTYERAAAGHRVRRERLHSLVAADAWTWPRSSSGG